MSEPRVTTVSGEGPLAGDQSLGALVNSAIGDLKSLVKMEKELAVAEAKQAAAKAAPAIAGFVVAAVAMVLFVLIGSMALAITIGDQLTLGWGFTIVAGAWLVLGGLCALVGRSLLKKITAPERTIRTVKDTAEWARHPTGSATAASIDIR
jgi:hypothetical protein